MTYYIEIEKPKQAEFFDETMIVLPDYQLERFNYGKDGGRLYFLFDPEALTVKVYPSNTTITSRVVVKRELNRYYGERGYYEGIRHRNERANYGTVMHWMWARYLRGESLYWEKLFSETVTFLLSNQGWAGGIFTERTAKEFAARHFLELVFDIESFMIWVDEYNVRPIMIEGVLKSDKYRLASALDLVFEFDDKETISFLDHSKPFLRGPREGQPRPSKKTVSKTVRAIVDHKSGGTSGKDYALQLEIQKIIWEENYPDLPIDRLYNLAPRDHRKAKKPGCSFTEKTGKLSPAAVRSYITLGQEEFEGIEHRPCLTIMEGQYQRDRSNQRVEQTLTVQEAILYAKKGEDQGDHTDYVVSSFETRGIEAEPAID